MENFLAALIVAATPFLLAAMGELITERAGVLNLGVEGMMLMGAVMAFAGATFLDNTVLGLLIGILAGALMAGLFGVLVLYLRTNQAATGLALTIFGIGLSGLVGQGYVGKAREPLAKLSLSGVTDISAVTRVLLQQDVVVFFSLLMVPVVMWFFSRTRAGLIVRSVGDNHDSAHALGLPVLKVRMLAILTGGALAGLAGGYLSLAYTPMWGENMTAGRGWIALALVVFASWKPGRLLIGAYLFAAVTNLQFYGQGWGVPIPSQFLAMGPYLATIIVLVIISRDEMKARLSAPACIGKPFQASH